MLDTYHLLVKTAKADLGSAQVGLREGAARFRGLTTNNASVSYRFDPRAAILLENKGEVLRCENF